MDVEINHHFTLASTLAPIPCIFTHPQNVAWSSDLMRTTINIDDDLIRKAADLTGIREKASLVRLGLETLIERESGKRLARLGGTEKKLETIPRRRTKTK